VERNKKKSPVAFAAGDFLFLNIAVRFLVVDVEREFDIVVSLTFTVNLYSASAYFYHVSSSL
jgi:hypothetical protein